MATNDEIYTALLRMEGTINTMMGQVREHRQSLFGNGREGLRDRVQHLEDAQLSCPARNSWIWTFRGWLALAGVLVASVGAAAAVIKLL